jgi:hypothetical protein
MKRLPIVSAFLVCDSVSRDASTGKTILFGIFTIIFARQVPTTHPSLFLYASLTEMSGEYELWVDVVHVPSNTRVARFPSIEQGALKVTANNPLDYVEVVFDIRGLTFKEFGEHEFRLFIDGRPMAFRRIWVRSIEDAPSELRGVLS